MSKKMIRRLFDIKVEHCSLVDRAANKRTFILTKRKEEDMEFKDVLERIEDALDDIAKRVGSVEKAQKETEVVFTLEVDKKGARFSATTMGQLRALHSSLGKLIGDTEKDADEDTDTKKGISTEEVMQAITTGIERELSPSEEKDDKDEEISKVVAEAVKIVLEKTKEQ